MGMLLLLLISNLSFGAMDCKDAPLKEGAYNIHRIGETCYYETSNSRYIYYYDTKMDFHGRIYMGAHKGVEPHEKLIIMIKGGPGSDSTLHFRKDLEEELASSGYNFLFYHQRGWGDSVDNFPDMMDCRLLNMRRDIEDLLAIKQIYSPKRKVSLVASSHGGILANLFLSHYPEFVDRVLFVRTITDYRHQLKRLFRYPGYRTSNSFWSNRRDVIKWHLEDTNPSLIELFDTSLEDFQKRKTELANNLTLYKRDFLQTPLSPEAIETLAITYFDQLPNASITEQKILNFKEALNGKEEAWDTVVEKTFGKKNYIVFHAHLCFSTIPSVGHLFESKTLKEMREQCERVFICPKDDPHYNPMTNYLEKDIREKNPVKSLLFIPTEDDRVNPLHSIEFSNLFPNSHYLLLPMDHSMGGKITNYKDERKLLPEEEVMFEATRNFFLDEDPLKRYETNRTTLDEELLKDNEAHHTPLNEDPLKKEELKKHPLPPVPF